MTRDNGVTLDILDKERKKAMYTVDPETGAKNEGRGYGKPLPDFGPDKEQLGDGIKIEVTDNKSNWKSYVSGLIEKDDYSKSPGVTEITTSLNAGDAGRIHIDMVCPFLSHSPECYSRMAQSLVQIGLALNDLPKFQEEAKKLVAQMVEKKGW